MPSKQTSTASRKPAQSSRSTPASSGERDEHYDLISVLYHSLKAADLCAQYADDARNADDEELVAFFDDTRTEHADRAQQAKELLAQRIEGGESELEEEEEEDVGEEEDEDDED